MSCYAHVHAYAHAQAHAHAHARLCHAKTGTQKQSHIVKHRNTTYLAVIYSFIHSHSLTHLNLPPVSLDFFFSSPLSSSLQKTSKRIILPQKIKE
jgi:hypothetical protein